MDARKSLSFAAIAALTLGISGCGDSREAVVEDTMAEMKSATETLKGITDIASAKANEAKLKAHGEKFKALKVRSEKFGKDEDIKKQFEEKYGKEAETVGMNFGLEMMRVGMLGPEAQKAIQQMIGEMK